MQHKVELSLVLRALMAGRKSRRIRTLINSEGRMIREFSAARARMISSKTKEADIFY